MNWEEIIEDQKKRLKEKQENIDDLKLNIKTLKSSLNQTKSNYDTLFLNFEGTYKLFNEKKKQLTKVTGLSKKSQELEIYKDAFNKIDTNFGKCKHLKGHQIVFIGPACAGRTVLLKRKVNGIYREELATIGATMLPINFPQHSMRDFRFYDTSGQEQYVPLLNMYLMYASIVVLCYRTNDAEMMEQMPMYFKACQQSGVPPEQRVLLRLQCDIELSSRNEEFIRNMQTRYGFAFHCDVSAKTNAGVDEFFDRIADYCVEIGK